MKGVQDAVRKALNLAYFTCGWNIGDTQTLFDVVAIGLNRRQAEEILKGDQGLDAMREAEQLSRRHRVDGAAFFIINSKITRGGGTRSPEAFFEGFGSTRRTP